MAGELSFPLLWKTKQALSPFPEELAPCPLCSDPATPSPPASRRTLGRGAEGSGAPSSILPRGCRASVPPAGCWGLPPTPRMLQGELGVSLCGDTARRAWLGLGREDRVALAAARLRAGLVCSRVFGFAGLFF